MSFSGEVKAELSGHLGKSIHCRIAELAALIAFLGKLPNEAAEAGLPEEKYRFLVKCLFSPTAAGTQPDNVSAKKILGAVRMWDETRDTAAISDVVHGILVQQSCCRRAYIRGAFLVGGSISDPNKAYHFEIVCRTRAQARQLQEIINSFGMDAKCVERKKHQVVYLKEGEQIVDLLNIMEAHVALMNLENVRILKEMRNSVNRKVNCETANITKTVSAAVRQLDDIEYIRSRAGLDSLPDNLKETALLRLEYPDATLGELGSYLNPPVGKSGVNHRLRKISELADALRDES